MAANGRLPIFALKQFAWDHSFDLIAMFEVHCAFAQRGRAAGSCLSSGQSNATTA